MRPPRPRDPVTLLKAHWAAPRTVPATPAADCPSVPELLFAVPVHRWMRDDLAITLHARLAGEPQFVLVAQPREERDRSQQQSQSFQQTRTADVFLPLDDMHAAARALSEP